jgi:hypothetical protein
LYAALVLAVGMISWQLFVPPIIGLATKAISYECLGRSATRPCQKGRSTSIGSLRESMCATPATESHVGNRSLRRLFRPELQWPLIYLEIETRLT